MTQGMIRHNMATEHSLVVSTILIIFLQTGFGQGTAGPVQISISPSPLVMTPNVSDTTGGQVTVTCRPSSIGAGDNLVAMNIERVLHSNPNAAPVSLAGASSTQNDGNALLTLQSLQASVSGSVSQRVLTLTLTRANCGDGGMYICTATALTESYQTRILNNSASMTIQVSPGPIVMTSEPSGTTNWRVKETLLMRCNGIVGTFNDQSQIEWVWEYQDGTAGFGNWQSYSVIGNPDTDINTGPIESSGTSNTCYTRQTSELTRYLTVDDTGRQYRCYVNNRDVSSQSVDYAQVYTVGTVTKQDVQGADRDLLPKTTGKASDDQQATCNCPDAGTIIGAVAAGLVVIDVVIVAVVIMPVRRRLERRATSLKRDKRENEHDLSFVVNGNAEARCCPVSHSPVSVTASRNPYDRLNADDIGIASEYQDPSWLPL